VALFGLALIFIASFLQGSFYLPGTYTKRWEWEHTWTFFSLFGMIVFSWIFILVTVPNIFSVYGEALSKDIVVLLVFGGLWGIGAICNGLAMDRLGMALAFPIVIGTVSALGALIPLIVFFPSELSTLKGLVVIAGTVVVVIGIVLCSRAFALKEPASEPSSPRKGTFAVNLAIAITAGVMSSLLNVGFAYSEGIVQVAKGLGIPGVFAANAAWALILTAGGTVNVLYCFYLMAARGTFNGFFVREGYKNLALGVLMGLIWCAGLFMYGFGTANMGSFGVVAGWVLFMTIIIIIGNMWGIFRGEWKGAASHARALLNTGMAVLIVAIIIVAASNML